TSELIQAVLVADTVTKPPDARSESSTAARVVFVMALIVSDRPRAAPMAAFWLTAIDNAAAPAVAMIDEQSCAVTLTPEPPSRVLTANEAPMAMAAAVPWLEAAMEIDTAPAAAMISDSLLAVTVTAPGVVTVLKRRVAVVSASIWFTEPEPAPVAATPLPC